MLGAMAAASSLAKFSRRRKPRIESIDFLRLPCELALSSTPSPCQLRQPGYAWNPFEVHIAHVKNQQVLGGEGGNPEVVRRNRSPGCFQAGVKRGIMVGRGIAAIGDPHAGLVEQFAKDTPLSIPAFDRMGAHSVPSPRCKSSKVAWFKLTPSKAALSRKRPSTPQAHREPCVEKR